MKIINTFTLFFFLFSCSAVTVKKPSFEETYFHKYGVLKFDLRDGSFPGIKFYAEGKIKGSVFELNSRGFFKGLDQICSLNEKRVLEPTKSMYRSVCNEGHPFTSGFSERTNAPFLEVEFESYKNSKYELSVFNEKVSFLDPVYFETKHYLYKDSCSNELAGIECNFELKSDGVLKTGSRAGVLNRSIKVLPSINFYADKNLKGLPVLSLSSDGVLWKGKKICEAITLSSKGQVLKSNDFSYDEFGIDLCVNGKPLMSALSQITSNPFLFISATLLNSSDSIYVADMPDGTKGYFKFFDTTFKYYPDGNSVLKENQHLILESASKIMPFLTEIQTCVQNKDIPCLLKYVHPSFKKQAIQSLRLTANEFFLLEQEGNLASTIRNSKKPTRLKPIIELDNSKLQFVYWPSIERVLLSTPLDNFVFTSTYTQDWHHTVLARYSETTLGQVYELSLFLIIEDNKPSFALIPSITFSESERGDAWLNFDLDFSL